MVIRGNDKVDDKKLIEKKLVPLQKCNQIDLSFQKESYRNNIS